jgi:hypothetical protein
MSWVIMLVPGYRNRIICSYSVGTSVAFSGMGEEALKGLQGRCTAGRDEAELENFQRHVIDRSQPISIRRSNQQPGNGHNRSKR